MPWAKFDDQYPNNLKVSGLSDAAFRLHVSAICFSSAQLTDGFVPSQQLRRFGVDAWESVRDELIAAGLFELVEGGVLIHDYLVYNPTREAVESRRDFDRRRKGSARNPRGNDAESMRPVPYPSRSPSSNPENPVPAPPGEPNAGAREAVAADRDEWRDAVSEGVYRKPYERLMPSERGEVDAAADDLEGSGVQPPAILAACDYWRRDEKYKALPLRPGGLIRNWSVLEQRMNQNGATTSAPHRDDRLERERDYAAKRQQLLAERDHGTDAGGSGGRAAPDAPGPHGVSRLPQPTRGP